MWAMKDLSWQCKGMSSNLTIFLVPKKCEWKSSMKKAFRKPMAALEM